MSWRLLSASLRLQSEAVRETDEGQSVGGLRGWGGICKDSLRVAHTHGKKSKANVPTLKHWPFSPPHHSKEDNCSFKPFPQLMKMSIPLFFLFTCIRGHIHRRILSVFCKFAITLPPLRTSLEPFSDFGMIMFFKLFFLRRCTRSGPPLMPPLSRM